MKTVGLVQNKKIRLMSGGNWKDMFKGVQTGDYFLVEYYLRSGIDPNYQHPEFMTTFLIESIRHNHLKIAKLLLDKGANPNTKQIWGDHTPISIAKLTNNTQAIELLDKYVNYSK